MIDLAQHIDAIARRLLGVPNAKLSTGAQLRFGAKGSIAVEIAGRKRGQWFDHEASEGGGPLDLVQIKGGIANGEVVDWLRDELGINVEPAPERGQQKRIVATYDYRTESGALVYQAVRYRPRAFKQRRPDEDGAGWVWKLDGVRRVPYRLPELIATPLESTVYVAEGEKDVDNLVKLGLAATCNSEGAGKWRPEFAEFFRGRDVVVFPDNDEPGRAHAETVADAIALVARRVRVVELPGLPPKGDVSDWLAAGGTREQLEALAAATAPYRTEAAGEEDAETAPVIDTAAPFTTAKLFLTTAFAADDAATLHHHRGAFYSWNGSAYPELGETELRARLYSFLDRCVRIDPKRNQHPVKPTAAMVGNMLDGLRAAAHLSERISAPTWLDYVPDIEAEDVIACTNGLLHLPTRSLLPHTPRFFTYNAVDIAFEPRAAEPGHWLRFLDQLWPGDEEAIKTLQEIFGYSLTADTRQQKAFLLVGPKRSGKGTVARVLARLVGVDNAVAPTLAGLGSNFGLAPLIGKRVAIISDARLGSRADQHAIAERILSVTGEDMISVDRKFREAWTGRLQTRFLILSNELPRLADASGALAARFIVLMLTNSFYGREDLGLTDRLLGELTGILNWSIAGLHHLRQRGHFVQPASAAEAVQDLEDLGSPISAFLRERCVVAPGRIVAAGRLFEVWSEWGKQQGRDHPGTAQTFGRDLRSAVPGLKVTQPREDGVQHRFYDGVGLK